ncbi:MAG: FAD-dependent monooxygenase, partial [Clostridia bacterium]|nr:FAD-dependent monooxygenase [Clostridia bacterium]
MAEIIVAGGGNGGLVCAINLVRKGYKVTLFEKQNKDSLGIAQTDAIDMPAFDYAGIEIPEYFRRGKNVITFVPEKPESGTLTLPEGTETSLLVDRIELSNYLFSVAEKEGVSIRYGEEALSPVLLGSRVAGVLTNKGTYYADLVVDACGVNSPLRTKLPEHLKVNRPINKYDVIYSYRGYFNRVPEAPEPQTDYNIYFKDDGNVGFSWLITEFDRVDVLVCRFTRPEDNEISAILNETHKENPHMGLDLVYGGLHGVIPVCQPLGL